MNAKTVAALPATVTQRGSASMRAQRSTIQAAQPASSVDERAVPQLGLPAYERGLPTDEAVAHGIKTTAGVVTSAAVVMIAVFAVFATLSLPIFKQLGVGIAVAVLIDATLIRGVLVAATMKLLGDWNWYLPRWLEWLPRIGPGRGVDLPPGGEVAAPAS